jgi:hypothetical protein
MRDRTIVLVAAASLGMMLARIGVGDPPAGVPATDARNPVLAIARIFADYMVLERDRPVPVWGTAPVAAEVVVEFHALRARSQSTCSLTVPGKHHRWFPAAEQVRPRPGWHKSPGFAPCPPGTGNPSRSKSHQDV